MKIISTKHGQQRMQQRGRRCLDISIIRKYGEFRRGVFLLTRRRTKKTISRMNRWLKKASPCVQNRIAQVRKIIHQLEKLSDWMLVVSPTGDVITIYHADKRRQHKFMHGEIRPVTDYFKRRNL